MKASHFSGAQTAVVLKQAEVTSIGEVSRKADITAATFYNCARSMRLYRVYTG